jgi:hypothetical protein
MNDQHQRRDAGRGYRDEVSGRVDGEFAIKRRRDRQRGLAAHHQRVSVGRGFRQCFGGNHSACAGTVLHHDRLTERLGQLLRQNSGGDVGAAASGEADEDFDRLVRVCRDLGVCRRQIYGKREAEQQAEQHPRRFR